MKEIFKHYILEIMLIGEVIKTRNEGRRLIKEGAVEYNGKVVTSPEFVPEKDGVLKVGKHRFLTLKVWEE